MLAALGRHLQRAWWQPRMTPLTTALVPLAWLVATAAARRRLAADEHPAAPLRVPVIVVGNVIVGGAGKTPTVIAVVALLRAWGHRPGIVSRGHGRAGEAPCVLDAATPASDVRADRFGDEPLLMHRRTGAPVAVARRRLEAARHLLATHPEIDVVVADDGLQHHALPRDVEIVVFDGRGVGNGRTLPAGPLRERVQDLWPAARAAGHATPARFVLINGRWPAPPAHPLAAPAASCWQARRELGGAVDLADWQRGEPPSPQALSALRGRRVLAAAGIGDPERFFSMLEACGLHVDRLPLADHARFDELPWPAGTPEVVVTEKDAVKLAGRVPASTRVWVVTLDFGLPDALATALRDALAAVARAPSPHSIPRNLRP